jgi:hypothetical protein
LKRLILFIWLSIVSYSALSVEQTVIIDTFGKTEFEIRNTAKNQALLQALDDLPNVVWGKESLSQDAYAEHIESIGYAHAKVVVLSEVFDNQSLTYTLRADVQFDQDAILDTLDLVAKGRFSAKTLAQIHALIGQSSVDKYIASQGEGVSPHIEAKLFSSPYFYAQSFAELTDAHENLIAQLNVVVVDQLRAKLDKFSFTLEDVNKDTFTYRFTGPAIHQAIKFTSPELDRIYSAYQHTIHEQAGTLCLFSPTEHVFFELPYADPPEGEVALEAFDVTLKLHASHLTQVYADDLYTQSMEPFDIVFCDQITAAEAHPIRRAAPNFFTVTPN